MSPALLALPVKVVPTSGETHDAHAKVPGGERVPFLFTIKELQASGDLAKFGGTFKVPSYRGSTFLDPKVRSPTLKP